ncbi:MAG TPA: type II toxin-antitoxin system VapC family toxin [Candidatus Acidoferrum sp.]|nr:type II toxin-antitoxin system VapC family toxin [Candidatus Acidoferrum sp.]
MLYLDSSALLKHYFQEPGTDAVNLKINEELATRQGIFVSVVGYSEIFATLSRLVRDDLLAKQEGDLLQQSFHDDWILKLSQVDLTADVLAFIPGLVNKHPLRGADAVHLASALWLRETLRLRRSFGPTPGVLEFGTSDKQLKTAAALEGLSFFDPQNP